MKQSGGNRQKARSRFWLVEASSMSLLSLGGALVMGLAAHGAQQPADDYPMRQAVSITTLSDGQKAYVNDPYGFVVRQCVSFVAYKLREDELPDFANTMRIAGKRVVWGSAKHWDSAAREAGFTISATPKVGAVAQWRAGEESPTRGGAFIAGAAGHVGYVSSVDANGWATVQEYNGKVSEGYSVMKVRAPRYLYISS